MSDKVLAQQIHALLDTTPHMTWEFKEKLLQYLEQSELTSREQFEVRVKAANDAGHLGLDLMGIDPDKWISMLEETQWNDFMREVRHLRRFRLVYKIGPMECFSELLPEHFAKKFSQRDELQYLSEGAALQRVERYVPNQDKWVTVESWGKFGA